MDRLAGGENELEASLRLYAYSQASLQKTCNPSGCPANGKIYSSISIHCPSPNCASGGLGEPKFNVDGTPFLGSWGRPQRVSLDPVSKFENEALLDQPYTGWARLEGNNAYSLCQLPA